MPHPTDRISDFVFRLVVPFARPVPHGTRARRIYSRGLLNRVISRNFFVFLFAFDFSFKPSELFFLFGRTVKLLYRVASS